MKASISHLEEHQRQMQDAVALAESAAASGDPSIVPETCLRLQPEYCDASHTRLLSPQVSYLLAILQSIVTEDHKRTCLLKLKAWLGIEKRYM